MKISKTYITLFIVLISSYPLTAQNLDYDWTIQSGGKFSDMAPQSVTTDNLGNIITTGRFEKTVDFDPDTGVLNLTSMGLWDSYIQKIDPNGNLIWVNQIGGSGYDQVWSIITDKKGNIYSTGTFTDTVDFNPDTGKAILSALVENLFIQKLNPSGSLIWVKKINGPGRQSSRALTLDSEGNIYITGNPLLVRDCIAFDNSTIPYSILNKNLQVIKTEIYDKLSFNLSDFIEEPEGIAYDACQFNLNEKTIICRSAKITPKKVGQFVTFWKRDKNGVTVPYSETDNFDFYVVNVTSKNHRGQFVFPKAVLIHNGIVTTKSKDGKRGFRVYPNWDTAMNKQAERTQKWQLDYFYEINSSTDLQRVNKLYHDT